MIAHCFILQVKGRGLISLHTPSFSPLLSSWDPSLQRCSTTAQQLNSTTYSTAALQSLQHSSTTARQHNRTTARQHNSDTTAPQHNSTTAQENTRTATLQHRSTTTQQHCSTRVQHHKGTTANYLTVCADACGLWDMILRSIRFPFWAGRRGWETKFADPHARTPPTRLLEKCPARAPREPLI